MKLKKLLLICMLVALVAVLASCGSKCTVTFDSNGGTPVAEQVVKSGKPVTEPAAPTKDGYIFDGWFNGDNEWNFASPVTSDMTLVAKWEIDPNNCPHEDEMGDGKCDICGATIKFRITYMDGKKQIYPKPDSYSVFDTNFKLPNATKKKNYEFIGWYADPEFTQPVTSIDVTKGGDLLLYAKYELITYTLTYNLNEGTNAAGNPTTYTVNDVVITLQDPTRDGYRFLGWYTDNAFTKPITQITKDNIGNLTLYARWANPLDEFTVTYLDHNGNELLVESLYKSESDQPLKPSTAFPELNVPGYFFIAWVNANDESQVCISIPAGNTEDIVVKATLKNEAVHYVLYYIDGEFALSQSFYEVDGLDTFYVPTKGGFTFDGWYLDRSCTTPATSIEAGVTEDIKLYGKFLPGRYSISFEIDGVTVDLGFNEYEVSNDALDLPAIPEKNGYVILGWYTADDQLMEENKIAAGYYGNLELHAKYEKVSYKITYHLNGGTNDDRNVTEYRFEEIPTLYDAGEKTGYKFAGWYTDATFNGTPINDLTAVANQDVPLFALWIPDVDEDHSNETPSVPF